ncbi:hypothetical protein E2C01_007103 [Portunus trituberculatus]|uniref:Uncharacterized protein n=1 Tax=Portunus trituberculatus TaxID=210409 RepID=A0A5B7CY98_PORTR|nr:hypothetical protein [Portunus trituberculatus]
MNMETRHGTEGVNNNKNSLIRIMNYQWKKTLLKSL